MAVHRKHVTIGSKSVTKLRLYIYNSDQLRRK